MIFNEFTFYSPTLDAESVRLSMVNARNDEYFMILQRDDPKDARRWKERRNEALGWIQEAIERQFDPGEVVLE